MKRNLIICLIFVLGGFLVTISAQERDTTIVNSEQLEVGAAKLFKDTITPTVKSLTLREEPIDIKQKIEVPFKPNSTRSVIYSAVFPGLGQIYNRRYWKLPIIYGGFLGVVYAVTWNGRYYRDYTDAFRDLYNMQAGRPGGDSWKNFVPSSVVSDIENDVTKRQNYLNRFRRQKDFYRRNRDLAIIIGVGLYALCIIDAYVDAQLYDFNMSEDLSMRIEPVIWTPTPVSKTSVGITCKLVF